MSFILVLHVIICVLLVITVLMQAGRGGGLTETFQSAESMFGTQTNAFMVRTTTVLATMFLCTSLYLAAHSANSNKSLMANKSLLATLPKTKPQAAQPENNVQVNVAPAKPVAAAPNANTVSTPVTSNVSDHSVTTNASK